MAKEILLPTSPSLLSSRNTPYVHRDLSWLQFNDRVLAEARSSENPLLERLKFLAITASNLDEFFMIRYSSLHRKLSHRSSTRSLEEEASLNRVRSNILTTVGRFGNRQKETFEHLTNELKAEGVFLIRKPKKEDLAFAIGKQVFSEQVLPLLSAPESFIVAKLAALENLQMVALADGNFMMRIPKSLPGFFTVRQKSEDAQRNSLYAFFLDDLLRSHLPEALGLAKPTSLGLLRITRDADFTVDLEEEDTESIPEIILSNLKTRDRGRFVRLQTLGYFAPETLHKISHRMKILDQQIFSAPGTFHLAGLWALLDQVETKPGSTVALRYPPFKAFVPNAFQKRENIFERLKIDDYLFHQPYDSFDSIVVFIQEAAKDPLVEKIEQTVYRIDALSPVVEALKEAAKTKKVRVLIELRARFDELNNLKLADELKRAGVEVKFGFGKLKLHAKVALVTRREGEEIRHYTHLSTGNYNASTARQYTDLAILSSNPEFGQDAQAFLDATCQGKVPSNLKQLVSAPLRLHRKLMNLIEAETEAARQGKKARIIAKVNALVDESLVQKLYESSQAGVHIDLIVRGACSLIPGVKGLSENIRVISLVDRFLEHSRIYYFEASKAIYLSSADWMPRNLFSRLELAFPILDPKLYAFIEQVVLPAYLLDTGKAKELTPQGSWKKRSLGSLKKIDEASLQAPWFKDRKQISAQTFFIDLASSRYKNTILADKGRKPNAI